MISQQRPLVQDIVITGQAVERTGGDPLANVPLKLVITLNGFERTYNVFTGADGIFSHTFKPLKGESGVYRVRAAHPGLTDKPVHGQFVINKVAVTPAVLNLNVPKNYKQTVNIRVQTGDGTSVDNLRLEYAAADQLAGEKPSGVHLTAGQPVAQLGGKKTANLPFTIWADNTAGATERLNLTVKSGETDPVNWGRVTINARFSEAKPSLYFTPNHIEAGMALNDTVTETVTLKNNGLADMYDVQLSLLNSDGTEAPNWVYPSTTTGINTLTIGSSQQVGVTFAPTDAVAEGDYTFKLRVKAANHATTDINLYAAVTQSGAGNVLFKLSDIYTGTFHQNGDLIEGLAGARVKLQNEETSSIEYNQNSDNIGEAYFEDIPAGPYKCRITANNHQEYIGRIWIKPGVTVNEEVFLDYNLVTVEWQVNEITIEDKYEIVLSATYESNVPAAVVVVEPSSVTLPKMKAGDVFNGEFTLTNYGLIRADNLDLAIPPDDQYFKYELLAGLPSSLGAKERITVPYRVTSIKSLEPDEDGQASGGGCSTYMKCVRIYYDFVCSNGTKSSKTIDKCWLYQHGDCSGSSGSAGPAGGGIWGIRSGIGGSSKSSPAPAAKTIEGVVCWPASKRTEVIYDGTINPLKKAKEFIEDVVEIVGCSVNTVTREFNDDGFDILVKVPGGMVEVKRLYYGNQWHWEHLRNNLTFNPDSLGTGIAEIVKGGVIYEASAVDSDVFTHDTYRISRDGSGYRWQDSYGNFKTYDQSGRMTAYGSRINAIGKLLYEPGENGRLIGVADRNDSQVLWYEYDVNNRIAAIYDADNRRIEYDYSGGKLSRITDVLGNDTTYEYDSKGRIKKKIDAAGRPTVVTYDSYGNAKSAVDSEGVGHFFEFEFDEAKREQYARTTTSAGRVKEVWYDRDGETRQVSINGRTIKKIDKDGRDLIFTDEKGRITRKEYDEWDNLTRVIFPDDSTVAFEYEHTFNKVVRVTDQRGVVSELAYDEKGNLTGKTEAADTTDERVTSYTYYEDGKLHTATVESDAATVAVTTTFTYDDSGNLATITGPMGHVTQFLEYDNMGNLLKMEDPRGNEWVFEYDDMGRLLSQTDPLSNSTAYEYDGANNRKAVINSYLKRFEFEYDDHNNLIKAIDPYQKYITTEYNTDNLPDKVIDQEGKFSNVEYDNEGRVLKTIDGAGNEIIYNYDESSATTVSSHKPVRIDYPTFSRRLYYDEMGRVVRETDILDEYTSHSRSYVYDKAGNVVAGTDEDENTSRFEYDALNRLVKTIDARGGEIKRKYDYRGNLIEIQDPNQGITWYEYDLNNRLLKVIRPMLEETAYEYDEMGNRTAVLDSKGQKIAYEYNELNRLTKVLYYAAGDHNSPIKTVDFTYDKLGNIKNYDDETTSAVYEYDDLQRKIRETVDYGLFSKTIEYTYFANGLKKTFTGPDGVSVSYSYDESNRLTGVAIPDQGQLTYLYDSEHWNSPAGKLLPGGSREDYSYDPLMRIKSINVKDPGQNSNMTRDYTYSAAGNINVKSTEHGNYQYQYDELQRLTESVNPLGADEAYTYDPLGNRLTAAGVTGTWSYNANNELEGYANVAFTYDDNGNTIRKTIGTQEFNYAYDVEDRLVQVDDGLGAEIANYYYDPFGRKLYKEVDGIRTYFVYSNEGLIGEYDETGAEIKTYGWVPDSQWSTDPLFYKQQGQYYWYQNDHLGTPQKIVETSGRVVWSAVYDSFGNVQIETAEIENNLRFAGQYYDKETGLYYNLNRYYDPTTGRYLRTDPFGEGLNLYSYVFNNPLSYIDPLGLCAVDWTKEKIKRGLDYLENQTELASRYLLKKYNSVSENLKNKWKRAKNIFNQVLGDKPGDIFTIGFSTPIPVIEYLGFGVSLDRVVLSDGKADWFLTVGGGAIIGSPSLSIDRGKARNFGDDPAKIEKEFIEKFSVSSDLSLGLIGLEVIAANPLDEQNEIGIIKGGLRTGVGLNLFGNWTFDLPWF